MIGLTTQQKALERRILSELSVDEVYKHVLWLDKNVGQRLAGTPQERKTAKYFKETLEGYGVPVRWFEFDAHISLPKDAELKVLSPVEKEIPCSCFAQVKSTPPEGIRGELVYVGQGGVEDYEGKDVRRKITLADLSYAPPRPEKVRLTELYGAIGQVMINWSDPEFRVLPLGTVKRIWGNPTPETIGEMPNIPAVGVTRADGEWLKGLCGKGHVEVWMRAEAWRGWGKVVELDTQVEGTNEPEHFPLVGGHYDAWGPAATCNATGNAMVLELARVFAKHRQSLRRSVRFAWWTAHETGIMDGSTWYVDNFWDDLSENAIVYMNVDSPGMKDTLHYGGTGSKETVRFHLDTVRDVLGEKEVKGGKLTFESFGRPAKTGDQSFWGIGLPSFWGNTRPLPGKPYLGWWYHSAEDTPDKVDLPALEKALKMYGALIFRLCNSPAIPFEFVSYAQEYIDALTDLQAMGKGTLDLTPLIDYADALKREAVELDKTVSRMLKEGRSPEAFEAINRCLMRLSRILMPVGYTLVGRYDQDTYGRTETTKPIPVLQPIARLATLDPESDDFKLLKTRLLRERNKVADALIDARRLIRDSLLTVE